MPASQPNFGTDSATRPAPTSPGPGPGPVTVPASQGQLGLDARDAAPPTGPTAEIEAAADTDDGHGLRLAVSEQAELLALLTDSVREGVGPLADTPTGAVDLIGALGPLDREDAPGSDPLRAFAAVAPRFAQDAEQVIANLGGSGQAA